MGVMGVIVDVGAVESMDVVVGLLSVVVVDVLVMDVVVVDVGVVADDVSVARGGGGCPDR